MAKKVSLTRAPAQSNAMSGGSLLAAAEQQLSSGRIEAARAILMQALEVDPQSSQAHNLSAIVALMRQEPAVACEHARQAVTHAPQNAAMQFTLGRALKAAGELDDAVRVYRCAIELEPRFAEAHVSLGIALKAQGDLDAAIACYRRAIELAPQLAVAHANLAVAINARAERDAAHAQVPEAIEEATLQSLQTAARLDAHDPELQRNLGAALLRSGRYLEAAEAFNKAITLHPQDLEACLHLVRCLVALGDYELVRTASEKWLTLNEQNAEMMRVLANAMTMLGEADAGLAWAERSLALEPHPVTAMQLGNSLLQARRIAEGLARCREGVETSGRDLALYPVLLMALNYWHEDPAPIIEAHAEFAARLGPAAGRAPRRARAEGERLRVGYVSGDFVRHSVPYFFAPLLQNHDPQRVDVVCYHNNARSDAVTGQLKSYGHRWVECAHLSDDALARRIRDDGIDILIDLTGQTASSRVLMFAQAPAPVQMSYLGYPTVSGVPAIDWRITDACIDPGDMPNLPFERPLVLPRSMFCYQPPHEAPECVSPPLLRNGHVTFGSFNNIAKVTDHTLALWAAAMQAVPGSRLLLKAASMAQPSNRRNIEQFMAGRGIAPERLSLQARRAADSDHLALYNDIDIALDTYPYNGATTTCEALWMGLPVVSLRGRTHTSRMGASILGAIGRSDWVAHDDAGYTALAASLAADVSALLAWRAGARAHLGASPLCDGAGFARAFESALEQAWQRTGIADMATPSTAAK